MQSPFPYFGGKSRAAELIWSRFGNVVNYVEPFFGSGAVLLQRPRPFHGTETVNDKDGLLANFWRALQHDPEAVAFHADNPVNENDLHARHIWLVENRDTVTRRLDADPEYFDPKLAGWWVWGISCWIGSGWCSGNGPWRAVEDAEGVRQLVHLGDQGRGVNRKRVHLGDQGQGVNRKRVELIEYFSELADRLREVRVCCGDWKRVTGPSVTTKHGLTAVLLDPPYADTAERQADLYAEDCLSIAHGVRKWAIANGGDRLMRIALCGYEGEHEMPGDWESVEWHSGGGFDGQNKDKSKIGKNRAKERIWFSPHCVKETLPLFAMAG